MAADKVVEKVVFDAGIHEGMTVALPQSKTQYTAHHIHPDPFGSGRQVATLRRATPKLRGKAARRADKAVRRDKWRP